MPRIDTEFFIARRLSSREGGPKNVMVRIATVTVALSVAVMIVALAVIFGFREQITRKLIGFGSHVEIVNLDGNSSFERMPMERDARIEGAVAALPGFSHIQPYAVKGGIIKTQEAMQGIMLKGVDADYDWSFFAESLVEGRLPHISDTSLTKDVVISRSLSRLLRLEVDDRVEMLFVNGDRPPRRDRFKVTGIYNTGLEEMDMVTVVTDVRNVQRLNGWEPGQITGYEVAISDFGRLEPFTAEVDQILSREWMDDGQSLMAVSVEQRNPNLFDWLRAHNVNAAVIITIMLLVSLLTMISALLIILLERTRMIGVLKSLGMNNRSVQKIFVIRSAFILAKGLIWGNVAGVGLCLIQKYTHLVKLDEAGYFLSEVPVQLDVWWLAALNAGTFLLILALLVIPTSVASRIMPEKTIRYQ